MNGKDIQERFPLAYEIYKALTFSRDMKLSKKNENHVLSMNKKEIMKYDAELYYQRQGRPLDWSNLRSYTEKMQWAKIFDDDPRKSLLSDKYQVREWVKNKIGENYLIPLIGKWERYEDINFSKLPNQFVIKTNHGSSDVVIVRDKSKQKLSDKMRMKRIITSSMQKDYAVYACELHYSTIKPQIIVEEYIDSGENELQDFKFLCFDGVPYYCWVDVGRYTDHKRNVYDLNWKLQDWNQFHYGNAHEIIPKPKNFDEMIYVVKTLSQGFSHVRVDLYNVDGRVLFGEMTFTNGSGFEEISPISMDYELGDLWHISTPLME